MYTCCSLIFYSFVLVPQYLPTSIYILSKRTSRPTYIISETYMFVLRAKWKRSRQSITSWWTCSSGEKSISLMCRLLRRAHPLLVYLAALAYFPIMNAFFLHSHNIPDFGSSSPPFTLPSPSPPLLFPLTPHAPYSTPSALPLPCSPLSCSPLSCPLPSCSAHSSLPILLLA